LSIHLRKLDIDHIGQFRLCMISDADADILAFALNPFVTLGVKQIVWDIHDADFLKSGFFSMIAGNLCPRISMAISAPIFACAVETYAMPMPQFKLGESVPLVTSPMRSSF